jgi:uncharacterized protein (TIGR03435 family)
MIRAALVFLTLSTALAAQAPASFEVASIKANRSGENRIGFAYPPGGLTITNLPVKALIIQAYRIQDHELFGLPDWASSERFDITAKAASADVTGPDRLVMLQALLVDRFKLRIRTEMREMSVYALTFARDDRQLGPNITPSTVDCVARSKGAQSPPPPPPAPGARPPLPECSVSLGMTPTGSFLRAGSIAFPDLVRLIAQNMGRPVVDKTGLQGAFNVEMKFISEAPGLPGLPLPRPPATTNPDDNVPAMSTAVREQLGFKLEAGRAQVPVHVVDSVERPSED